MLLPVVRSAPSWISVPPGSLDVWKAARNQSASTPTTIAILGDSISSGVNASNFVTLGFPDLLKDAIVNAGYSWHADFWPVSWADAVTTPGGYAWAGTAPWSYTLSGDLVWSNGGYHKHLVWIKAGTNHADGVSAGAYDVATFVTPYATTKVVPVYHPGGIQSGFGWKVDGGTAIAATDAFDGYTKSKDSGVLSNAIHTVAFGNILGQFRFTLSGAITYVNAGLGIGMSRFGALGATVADWTSTAGQPSNIPRQFQGFYSGGTTGFGFPTQPSLAILEIGANDCHLATSVTVFREGLMRLASAFRRGTSNCSLVFVIPSYPDGVSSDVTTPLGNPFLWSQYVGIIYEVANLYNAAVVNIHAKWGETGVADGLQTSAIDLHPTDAGHLDIATTLASIVL